MNSGAHQVRVVLTSVENHAEAEQLARALLDERLIACANLVPGVTSIYRWDSTVHTGREVLLVLKTQDATLDRAVKRLSELHPYQLPEIIHLPPTSASEAYARWVAAETSEVVA